MTRGRVIRASQLLGREAVSIDSGASAGIVRDLMLDSMGCLMAAGIEQAAWHEPGLACPPEAFVGASSARLLFSGSTKLTRFRLGRDTRRLLWTALQGKTVVGVDGETLGLLMDATFDLPSGQLFMVHVSLSDGELQQLNVTSLLATGKACLIAIVGCAAAIQPTARELGAAGHEEVSASGTPTLPPLMEETGPPILTSQRIEARLAGLLLASAEAQRIRDMEVDDSGQADHTHADSLAETDEWHATQQTVAGSADGPMCTPPTLNTMADLLANRAPASIGFAHGTQQGASAPQTQRLFAERQALGPLDSLSLFERRKAQYMLGRLARRDILAADGSLIVGEGAEISQQVIESLAQAGLLDTVFLETAALTR